MQQRLQEIIGTDNSYVDILPRWYSPADCGWRTFGDRCVPSPKTVYNEWIHSPDTRHCVRPDQGSDGAMLVRRESPTRTMKACITNLLPPNEDEFPMYTDAWAYDPVGINWVCTYGLHTGTRCM